MSTAPKPYIMVTQHTAMGYMPDKFSNLQPNSAASKIPKFVPLTAGRRLECSSIRLQWRIWPIKFQRIASIFCLMQSTFECFSKWTSLHLALLYPSRHRKDEFNDSATSICPCSMQNNMQITTVSNPMMENAGTMNVPRDRCPWVTVGAWKKFLY